MSGPRWTRIYLDRSRGSSWVVWSNNGDDRGRTAGRSDARYLPNVLDAELWAERRAAEMRHYPSHYGTVSVVILPRAQRALDDERAAMDAHGVTP